MKEDYGQTLTKISEMIEKNKESNAINSLYDALALLTEVVKTQREEILQLKQQLNIKPEYDMIFDSYQLELLEYIFTNQSINENKLSEFYKKDPKYRVDFTKLKDEYVYKGWGGIYSDAVNYHIKPEKEKYVAEALAKAYQ